MTTLGETDEETKAAIRRLLAAMRRGPCEAFCLMVEADPPGTLGRDPLAATEDLLKLLADKPCPYTTQLPDGRWCLTRRGKRLARLDPGLPPDDPSTALEDLLADLGRPPGDAATE